MAKDSFVVCDKCGARKEVDFRACVRAGWPLCCGYTMRLDRTHADVEKAVKNILNPIKGFFSE